MPSAPMKWVPKNSATRSNWCLRRDGRALLTFNYEDFLTIGTVWPLAGKQHMGIIVSYRQYSRPELGMLRRTVLALLAEVDAEQLRNTVLPLDPFRQER
jgi:hypothetical protein